MTRIIPEQILKNENSWYNAELWRNTHYYSRDNAYTTVIGGNGLGKTYLALREGEILGVDERGEQTLFNPNYLWEHVTFEKDDLMRVIDNLNRLPIKKAKGYVIIPDEVQDTLSSKEAMYDEVKAISSYLATLRSRRYMIFFTCPSWNMLVKDARRIINYCQLMTRRPSTCSYSDLRYVKTDRVSDEPRLWRPRRVTRTFDSFSGMSFYFKQKWAPLTWALPSRKTIRAYSKLKLEAQIKKGQRVKERVVNSMQDKESKDKEELSKLTALFAANFDSEAKARMLVYVDKSGMLRVNARRLCRGLGISSSANAKVEKVFRIACELYPKVFSGTIL